MIGIKEWNKFNTLTIDEEHLLRMERSEDKIIKSDDTLKDLFFTRMFGCNLSKEWHITFDISASKIIHSLIDNLVDDNTLLIITDAEHNTIKEKEVFNKLIVKHKEMNVYDIIEQCKKYANVVFYMSGVIEPYNDIISQSFFVSLKRELENNKIKNKIILDDVKGMFLYPRDYSIFDYIIGTGHNIVGEYDLGILISKDNITGEFIYNWGYDYIKHLDVYLKRYNKMMMFNPILGNYYNTSNILPSNEFSMTLKNVIFTDKMIKKLNDDNILIYNDDNGYRVKMKAQYFIHPDYNLELAIDKFDSIKSLVKQLN